MSKLTTEQMIAAGDRAASQLIAGGGKAYSRDVLESVIKAGEIPAGTVYDRVGDLDVIWTGAGTVEARNAAGEVVKSAPAEPSYQAALVRYALSQAVRTAGPEYIGPAFGRR